MKEQENECLYIRTILEVERESFMLLTSTIHGAIDTKCVTIVSRLSNVMNVMTYWQAREIYQNQLSCDED